MAIDIQATFISRMTYHVIRVIEDCILFTEEFSAAYLRIHGEKNDHCNRCGNHLEYGTMVSTIITMEKGNLLVCNSCKDAILNRVDECQHEWVSAVNEVVKSGEICLKCNSV